MAAEKGQDDQLPPGEQPPFHYPIDYVIRTWMEHRLHHTYPESGGYNDQCPYLMDDWHTLSMIYVRAQSGVYSTPIVPNNDLFSNMRG